MKKRGVTATWIITATAACILIPAFMYAAPATGQRPWMDASLPPMKRAELLVHAMTLDEKIEQIHMADVPRRPREVPGIERLGIATFKITNGPAGAGPGDSQVGVPATALPSALALSATWDPKLAAIFGEIAGKETAARGEQLIEAPGVNIIRVPQNGRNFEYFGEDPYLSGQMAIPEIEAIQKQGVIAEVKHYAANSQETDRKTVNEIIEERTLREIYLPAFEASVKQGNAGAVMCAYPSVNGQFNCENVHLLKDILRGEWGFQGFVQSDYTATHSTIPAALAGLDLEMKHDSFYDADMKAAVLSGRLPESVVDTMLLRRYSEMFRMGTFDRSYSVTPIPAERDGALAREIAEQAAVLLKNSNRLLPLDARTIHSIAVIGPYAGAAHTGGGGSSAVTPLYTVSPVEGIKKLVGANVAVNYNDGARPVEAAALAQSADIAIVMVGNKDREGGDRPNLSLPNNQDDLVSAVAAANPRTIVVLKTGGPVLMPWLNKVPAVLEAWYPGEEDGNAIADLLLGVTNPSGKLTVTFPRSEVDVPAHMPEQYPGVNGTAKYTEGMSVGYRWYDSQKIEPLFPFGFGLSFTSFGLSHLQVSKPDKEGHVTVSLEVANTGSVAGSEVVQIYVGAPATAGEPPHQLKGFDKVRLEPQETRHVSVTLDARAFSSWDIAEKRWRLVPGRHHILVGGSSRDLPLQGTAIIRPN
jgi:beta-glucosidase